MLQRVQTLFLLGTVLLCLALMYLPIYELAKDPTSVDVSPPASVPMSTDAPIVSDSQVPNKQFTIFSSAILALINGAVGVLALLGIFLFKKRNLQIRVANLALLLNCILLGLVFFSADAVSSTTNAKVHYLYGSYFPIIGIVFLFLAVRFIKRDEELVRSADRLR